MAPDFDAERAALVRHLRRGGSIRSPEVEAALARVPRERFLPAEVRDRAYADEPVPIGEGQTMSAPHMVAAMLEALRVAPGMRVLEVGAGSGYHAATLADLVGPEGAVHTVEVVPELARAAERRLEGAGYGDRVHVHVGDGSEGWPAAAPYDRALVACAAPAVPPPLVDQLREGGVLVIPVGSLDAQELFAFEKGAEGFVRRRPLGPVRFVPMRGAHGFPG